MPASGVVSGLDPGEYDQPDFSFVFPGTPVDQLTFQGSKKALSHCVIIGIAYTTHRRTHAHFPASFAKLNAGVCQRAEPEASGNTQITVARRYSTPIKALNLPQKHGFVS